MVIDEASNATLNQLLNKLGVSRQQEQTDSAENKDRLGQADFLKLMTTQLQSQDPFAPMENGDFIAQMAQFSTVTGITEMGQSLKDLSAQLGEFRVAMASSLLGQQVLVPGNIARASIDGNVSGVIDLPAAAQKVIIQFSDEQGKILKNLDLGAQNAGLVGFAWDELPAEIRDADLPVFVDAYADIGKGLEEISSSVFARVLAAGLDQSRGEVNLDVRDYGTISTSDVLKFRN